ncbi:hypothetical protein [Streptomyces sp. NPDC096013]|uniref:hypothetical protein n=1 Tax=Streptomyces sp. NPDC096013 TaxID=3366069 RepID=UPI0037F31484
MTHMPQPSEQRPDESCTAEACAGPDPELTERRTVSRLLRREIAGTIGLLTDDHDFLAMQRYRSFAFDSYAAYREAVEDLLRTRAAQGFHTTLTIFDPEEYADFCTDSGLDPDAASSRTRFSAEIATTGPTIHYDGQPLSSLTLALVDEGVRQATWEYATAILARLGACAECGKDIGRTSFARASDLVACILDTARPGGRHLVCSVNAAPETLVAVLHADTGDDGAASLDDAEVLEFTTVLALGIATRSPGGLIMRISAPDSADQLYGWRLRGETLEPLTAGEVFDAYWTDAASGDPVPPGSNADYCVPPDLGQDSPDPGHRHQAAPRNSPPPS